MTDVASLREGMLRHSPVCMLLCSTHSSHLVYICSISYLRADMRGHVRGGL